MNRTKFVKTSIHYEDDAVEGYAEVPAEGNPPGVEGGQARVLGHRVDRYEAYDKLSGTAVYPFDVAPPGTVHAFTLRCPHPHAKIKRIDASKAEAMPGVLGVLHHGNTERIPWYEDSALFDTHLRYAGDEVAFIGAESEEIARRAAEAVEVEYEVLPFETDSLKAVGKGSPAYHKAEDGTPLQEVGGGPDVDERGDVEAGMSAADATVTGSTYTTSVLVHNPTEPHGSLATWEGDRLILHESTQAVQRVRDQLAGKLGLPESRVEVVTPVMGGGFGAKLELGKYSVMAALLARRLGRPVRVFLDREEMNLAVGNRPDSHQVLSGGVKRDGTLTALASVTHGMAGAYASSAQAKWPLLTMYRCENVRAETHTAYTNLGRARPFRAPGHPQGTFALDQLLDELAEKIGMDPLELRRRNIAEEDQQSGNPYTSKMLAWCYDEGAKAIGWQRRSDPAGSGRGTLRRGIGMASQIWWGGGGPPAGVTVKMNSDGSVRVLTGGQDIGTGTYTFLQQVAAEALEIPLEKISVSLGRSSVGPYAPLSGGSITAPSVSPAAWDAAVQVREALRDGAAALFEVDREQVRYKEGELIGPGEEQRLTAARVIQKLRKGTLVRTGLRAENPSGKAINSFGAQFAEVEVDIATGKVRVVKVVAAHDIGRTLNRKTLENQCEGGIIQGLGMALTEERLVDRATGLVVSTNLHDYKLPTVQDAPEIEVLTPPHVDTTANVLGVKGVGEPPIIPTAGAIANAVYNATGVRMRHLPMTPDRVLTALVEAGVA